MINFKKTILLFSVIASLSLAAVFAATNIDLTDKWAWNDARGWINFHSTNVVNILSNKIEGYAVFCGNDEVCTTPSADYILLDCGTSPGGDICEASNFKIFRDGNGDLSGWAWNDGVGWISFCGGGDADVNCPGTISYGVNIDSVSGDFTGWAWNDVIGWIDFNCDNDHDPAPGVQGICLDDGGHDFKVKTLWAPGAAAVGALLSNIFDTSVVGGVSLNSIIWRGDINGAGNAVKFQIASSNCDGGSNPSACDAGDIWSFIGPGGTSGDTDVYEPLGTGQSMPIVVSHHNNKQYYRYKVILDKAEGNSSPVVRDVIINWSP
ncbi:MAG TPA: hypothetical protein VI432_02560 [Candidatus Paceibacterota bacterium]